MKTKSVVNRGLLALIGIVLLGTGILVLAGSLDLYRRWRLTPPDGWPLTAPLTSCSRTPTAPAGRTKGGGGPWSSPSWPSSCCSPSGGCWLNCAALIPAIHPSGIPLPWTVWNCASAPSATLWQPTRGTFPVSTRPVRTWPTSASRPEAHLDLTLTPDSEPGPVLRALSDGPLERARRSTGRTLPAKAQLRVTPHKAHRAE